MLKAPDRRVPHRGHPGTVRLVPPGGRMVFNALMDKSRLRRIRVFADLDEASLDAVAGLAAEVSVPEGKELVREGDFSYEVIGIEDGQARVHHGEETLAELGPGDVFGELGLLGREQRNASVTATTSMLLTTLSGWDMRKLRKSAPAAVQALEALGRERRG